MSPRNVSHIGRIGNAGGKNLNCATMGMRCAKAEVRSMYRTELVICEPRLFYRVCHYLSKWFSWCCRKNSKSNIGEIMSVLVNKNTKVIRICPKYINSWINCINIHILLNSINKIFQNLYINSLNNVKIKNILNGI